MSWAVGFDQDHDRHRGYGVPAYCDSKNCGEEIDRGFGYLCDCERCWDVDELEKSIFVCSKHTCADVNEDDLPPDHPDWVNHVLTDESWARWRQESPERVRALTEATDR